MAFDAILCRFLQRCLTYKRNRFCPRAFCLFLSHHSFILCYLLHHHLHRYCRCHLYHILNAVIIFIIGIASSCAWSCFHVAVCTTKVWTWANPWDLRSGKYQNMGKIECNAHAESRMIALVYAAIAAVRSKKCLVKWYDLSAIFQLLWLCLTYFALCLVPCVLRQSK